MYQNFIFDLDGTLIDSSRSIISTIEETIEEMGLDKVDLSQLKFFSLSPIEQSFSEFYKLNKSQSIKANQIYRRLYARHLNEAVLFPQIKDLLKIIKARGHKIFIATYKRLDYAVKICKNLDIFSYFLDIYGSPKDNKFIAKEEIVSKLISDYDINCVQSILIGDTIHDAIAANKNNLSFIAVTYGNGFKLPRDLIKVNPLLKVNSIDELISWVYCE
ncbi:MAG: HAD hydrolase-like protein [Candidatus Caenarcaniphilales bacterium]|nr:HAD hydrolase-like protein [Candidatus Caenarcaniphilales bacterium]